MYEIQHYTLFDGWVNCWTQDGVPVTFGSREDAEKALEEYLAETEEAAKNGDLSAPYMREEFRICAILRK
jgi:hypothetical protein